MKVATILLSTLIAVASANVAPRQDSSTSSVATTTSASLTPQATCLAACQPGDVNCQAACVGTAHPNSAQANQTNECAAKCPQGDGSTSDSDKYASCVSACISSHFPTSQTVGAASGATGTVASNPAAATGTGSAASGASSATGTGASKSSGKGVQYLSLKSVFLICLIAQGPVLRLLALTPRPVLQLLRAPRLPLQTTLLSWLLSVVLQVSSWPFSPCSKVLSSIISHPWLIFREGGSNNNVDGGKSDACGKGAFGEIPCIEQCVGRLASSEAWEYVYAASALVNFFQIPILGVL